MRMMLIITTIAALYLNNAVNAQYYGRLISNGWGGSASNGLAGDVYAIDSTNFQIIGFSFDGSASPNCSDARFHGVKSADNSLVELFNADGLQAKLPNYNSENVAVPLLDKGQLGDYKSIGVYCMGTNPPTELGIATLPADFVAPAPQVIGQFSRLAHQVRSGDVTVLNDRMIKIEDFNYDGQGPDAYFYVGTGSKVTFADPPYGKIPDENGIVNRKARAYSDRTITLTLPAGVSATDISWLSMFCVAYDHDFGNVRFPADLNVPPYQEVEIDRQGLNCEPMNDKFQVAWSIDGDMINFELAGLIDRETEYMAFGLSGSDTAFAMVGADVVVADFLSGGEPRAVDYYLSAYAQVFAKFVIGHTNFFCATNGGACPDTSASNGASDDVKMPSARFTNGILRISYQRKLNTSDTAKDKVYKTDGTEQQVVWAIGPLNTDKETAKHYAPPQGRINENMAINFGRDPPVDNCPAFSLEPEEEKPKFEGEHLYGDESNNVFTVQIGQAGSEQGYKAITGLPSWGIAWYVNGRLVPELHLKKGETYTFQVSGGTNADEGSMYHPFYITDSIEGGYGQDPQGATIYKGTVNGAEVDKATGGYCEWKLTDEAVKKADSGNVYKCFQELKDDLWLDCVSGATSTEFKWTPDDSIPSTVYYQCYTHKNLGWKINLYDELPAEKDRIRVSDCSGAPASTTPVNSVTTPEQTSATTPTTGPSISQPASMTPSYENQTRVTTPVNNNQTGITTTARNNPMTVRITRSSSERVVMEENSRAAMSFPYVSMLFGVAAGVLQVFAL